MNESSIPTIPTGEAILEDRACETCGYNLKGLIKGGTCPECGTPIRGARRPHDDVLGDAPRGYLATLSLGFLLLGISGVLAVLVIVSLIMDTMFVVGGAVRGGAPNSLIGGAFRALAMPASAIGWGIGTLIVTVPRPRPGGYGRRERNGKTEWSTLRLLVRTGGLALALGMVVALVAQFSGLQALLWVAGSLLFAGLLGFLPMCVYLRNLADWAPDTSLGMRIMHAGVLLGACGVLTLMLATPLALIVAWMLAVGITVGIAWLSLSVLRMASMVSWAVKNARERRERDARMAERARQQAQEAAERSAQAFVAPDDEVDAHLLADIERKHAASQEASPAPERFDTSDQQQLGYRVDPTGADPYKLEDD